MSNSQEAVVAKAREYYNSDSADGFYFQVWGGEDIHIGLYNTPDEPIFAASQRTVVQMAERLQQWPAGTKVLDIGSGYGGSARHLVKTYDFAVDCLNLSEVQNQRNRQFNQEQGLAEKIRVVDGSFEDIPFDTASYRVVWSQDAILHSGNRRRVLAEVDRVLESGGEFLFTDPMQSDDCPAGVLAPVLARIHLDTLGSPGFYRQVASELGWQEVGFEDYSEQLVNHYSSVLRELEGRRAELAPSCGEDYLDRMATGLGHWIEAGSNGYLVWGIFQFRKG